MVTEDRMLPICSPPLDLILLVCVRCPSWNDRCGFEKMSAWATHFFFILSLPQTLCLSQNLFDDNLNFKILSSFVTHTGEHWNIATFWGSTKPLSCLLAQFQYEIKTALTWSGVRNLSRTVSLASLSRVHPLKLFATMVEMVASDPHQKYHALFWCTKEVFALNLWHSYGLSRK